MSDPVHDYLAEIGRKGGAAGRGPAKARTSEQARTAALARWGKRKKRAKRSPNAPAEGASGASYPPAGGSARLTVETPCTTQGCKHVFAPVHVLYGSKAFSKCPECGAFVDTPFQGTPNAALTGGEAVPSNGVVGQGVSDAG